MPPTQLFSALADDVRCKIIAMLYAEPLPVHRLAEAFPISRPAISRHLRVLSEAGLVAERKRGRENIYALRPRRLNDVRKWLEDFAPAAIKAPKVAEPAAPIVVEPLPAPVAAAPAKPKKSAPKPPPPVIAPTIEQMGFDF